MRLVRAQIFSNITSVSLRNQFNSLILCFIFQSVFSMRVLWRPLRFTMSAGPSISSPQTTWPSLWLLSIQNTKDSPLAMARLSPWASWWSSRNPSVHLLVQKIKRAITPIPHTMNFNLLDVPKSVTKPCHSVWCVKSILNVFLLMLKMTRVHSMGGVLHHPNFCGKMFNYVVSALWVYSQNVWCALVQMPHFKKRWRHHHSQRWMVKHKMNEHHI